jgi:antitoxin (DNA-binding transcriptional repressor) of toxin-antitoxin stability system
VEDGQEIVVKRADKPIARIVPFVPRRPERPFGLFAGEIEIHEDFDELPDELQQAFHGQLP